MSNNFLGEIRMFGGNFAPSRWALCDGQLLSIAQNQALFALLGTTFGGNGIQTFALPELRGRVGVGQGQGPGLTNRVIGESSGVENVTLTASSMPTHTHMLNATQTDASSKTVAANLLPGKPTVAKAELYVNPGSPTPTMEMMKAEACGLTGGSQPHNNIMPSLCITFIIALQGIFPSRN